MAEQKKILIVDDHSIVSRGLHYLITLNFSDCTIDQVPSLGDMMQQLSANDYTHVILDLNLEDGNSMEILPQVIEQYPHLYILIYTMASEDVFGKKLIKYNVSGFLSKKSTEIEIVQALQVFLHGGIYISKKLKKALENKQDEPDDRNVFHTLSINELKVLGLILKGSKTKEIAGELNVTQQTIATYKSRLFKKLGTENIFDIQKKAELYNINFS